MTPLAIFASDATVAIIGCMSALGVAVVSGTFGFVGLLVTNRTKFAEQLQVEVDRERKLRESAEKRVGELEIEVDEIRSRLRQADTDKFIAERKRDQLIAKYEGGGS